MSIISIKEDEAHGVDIKVNKSATLREIASELRERAMYK